MINDRYAIVVKREKKDDYFIVMPLEEIDKSFINFGRAGVLELMRQSDSILTETNPDLLTIKKIVGNKLIEDKNTPIIEDGSFLSFPLKDLLLDIKKGEKLVNILYNQLSPYLNKNVREEFKELILLLQEDKEKFVEKFYTLSYSEQRLIRAIIIKNIDIKPYLENIESLHLSRTKEAA